MQMIGEQPAQYGTQNAGAHEHDGGPALHDRPFARRQQVGNNGLRDRQQAAAADALQAARQDQKPDRRRQRARDRTGNEDSDGPEQNEAPAINVG
jgi:hypothetical protein